ncbi:hypothetical protein HZA40_03205 [Candidatus Peregrinibacteria bacterium]|nr:hypothetical protein [Candidatus Peregrinibacteria bacterium]
MAPDKARDRRENDDIRVLWQENVSEVEKRAAALLKKIVPVGVSCELAGMGPKVAVNGDRVLIFGRLQRLMKLGQSSFKKYLMGSCVCKRMFMAGS